jgi:hypothetical protein
LVTIDADHGNRDVVTDCKALSRTAAKNQHELLYALS